MSAIIQQGVPAPDAARIRSSQRAEWAVLAPHWRIADLGTDPPPIHRRLLAMAEADIGQRTVDLACGTGFGALLRLLGADGTYLDLDLSPQMEEIGSRWAQQQGLHGATVRAIGAETESGMAPESFNLATCLFGLMYMPEPVAALRALHTALVPGGRIAVGTWSSPERCPFLGVHLAIVHRHVAHPMLALTGPHPFAIPTPSALADLLAEAGFVAIQTAIEQRPIEPLSPEGYWNYMQATGWPLAFLPPLSADLLGALHEDVTATLTAVFPDGQVRLGGEANLAVAVRPA